MLADSTILLLTVPWLFDRDPASMTLADGQDSNFYGIIAQPIWAWSMALIKISVAVMLLRLEQERCWRRFLWAMIGLQVLLGIYNNCSQLLQCIPIEATWHFTDLEDAKCWSASTIRINIICVSTINITTDVIFALVPITFLRKIRRPMREKVLIGVLMGLGLLAAVASSVKVAVSSTFGETGDPGFDGISVGMWSLIEEHIGLIAACIPCLRQPFNKLLHYLGILPSTPTHPYDEMDGEGRNRRRRYPETTELSQARSRTGLSMKSWKGTKAASMSEEKLTNAGEGASGEIWRTTEVRMEEERQRASMMRDGSGKSRSEVWGCGEYGEEARELARKDSKSEDV